jgi:hypothetical protein
MSINKLIEELSTIALTEFDTHNRFKAMASQGNIEQALAILDKLDFRVAENIDDSLIFTENSGNR